MIKITPMIKIFLALFLLLDRFQVKLPMILVPYSKSFMASIVQRSIKPGTFTGTRNRHWSFLTSKTI
jgi:hypothetical protein